VVQLDALVVLKIIKHCQESFPDLVTGQLLGLDIANTLEVTNCFPFPTDTTNDDENVEESAISSAMAEYQLEMMKCLREVNVDNNAVGWYSSTYMGSFINKATIDTQYNYQEKINTAVVVVYDPVKTSQGHLSLKAYRLTQNFMALYEQKRFTKESMIKNGISFHNIFEEIPISIHNSHLVTAFLTELGDSGKIQDDSSVAALDLSTNPFLEKNLEVLLDNMDDLGAEQSKFQYYQRNLQKHLQQQNTWLQKRRAENLARKAAGEELLPEEDPSAYKLPTEPSRLDSLLISNQINNYCMQINQFSATSFTKLFCVAGLQKVEENVNSNNT